MIFDTKEFFNKIVTKDTGDSFSVIDAVIRMNELGFDVSLYSEPFYYRVVLRDKDLNNKKIVIENISEESFIDALGKCFALWYTVYCNKTFDELIE